MRRFLGLIVVPLACWRFRRSRRSGSPLWMVSRRTTRAPKFNGNKNSAPCRCRIICATRCSIFTARPHHVGSPYDKDNAEVAAAQFKSYGWDANIETFSVLFPTPKERAVELAGRRNSWPSCKSRRVPRTPLRISNRNNCPATTLTRLMAT